MEEFFYLILVIVWLIISVVKRKTKPGGTAQQQKQQPTAQPREKDLGDLLEEFLGKQQPGHAPQAEPGEAEQAAARMENQREEELQEYTYEQEQQPLYQEKKEEYAMGQGVMEEYLAEAGQEPASVEDLIKRHASEDARLKAEEELAYGAKVQQEVPEFDLRTAVIFSEILNRKYT